MMENVKRFNFQKGMRLDFNVLADDILGKTLYDSQML